MARNLVTGCLIALTLSASGACTKICADGVESNGKYRFTVVEPWREGGTFRFDSRYALRDVEGCGKLDGLTGGATIDLAGVGEAAAGECNYVVGKVEQAPAEVALEVHRGGGEGFIAATHEVTIAGCAGYWSLVFRAVTQQGVFSTPATGELPPVILNRLFQPKTESATCKRCADLFVVKMERR